MPAMTLQSIIDRAAAQADMADGFVQPQTWVDWYNVAARALALFMARSGWVYNFAVSQDNEPDYTIEIPDFPLAILGVYEVRDGRYRPLFPQSQAEFRRDTTTGDAKFYCASMDANSDELVVRLYPTPTSGTYRALFFALPEDLTLTDLETAATVQWPLGFEEKIVLELAQKALVKEESDTRAVEKLMEKTDQMVEEFCWSRYLADSPTIRNVDLTVRGWANSMIYSPYESWYWL